MKRSAEAHLVAWKNRPDRKPLILRGARQTGKTYLVEQFARDHFSSFLKLDFEFDLHVKPIFQQRNPRTIISELSRVLPVEVKAGKTGTLKSLHVFLHEKKTGFGIRLNMDTPSLGRFAAQVRLKKTSAEQEYTLMSLPLYLASQLGRILEQTLNG